MKICVFGPGAIGGYLAVELARAGREVSVVARRPEAWLLGPHHAESSS